MSNLELLMQTLDGSPSDHPVWTADISYWISGNRKNDLQSETGFLDFCADMGCMPYYWYDEFWAGERNFDECVEVRDFDICAERGEAGTEWKINSGWGTRELRQITRFSATSWSQATIEHAVKNTEDLKTLIEILEASAMVPSHALEGHRIRRERWKAYDGFPCIGLPRSPVSAFINEWAGVQNGLILLFEEPELCRRLFDLLEEQEQPILEACNSEAVDLVHFPDNLTSEVYTSIFDAFMRECYLRRLEKLHEGNVRAAVHLDGTVRGLLPLLCETGIDAVEAVTPAPVGDSTAAEMREAVAGSSTILWGGVPGAMFARPYNWKEMKLHVEQVLETWAGIPFVLGVADQVPPDGDIDTVRRIKELVE